VKKINEFGRIEEFGMPLLHSGGFKSLNSGNLGRFSNEKLLDPPKNSKREASL
jgi:hypothetical protein